MLGTDAVLNPSARQVARGMPGPFEGPLPNTIAPSLPSPVSVSLHPPSLSHLFRAQAHSLGVPRVDPLHYKQSRLVSSQHAIPIRLQAHVSSSVRLSTTTCVVLLVDADGINPQHDALDVRALRVWQRIFDRGHRKQGLVDENDFLSVARSCPAVGDGCGGRQSAEPDMNDVTGSANLETWAADGAEAGVFRPCA